ncbi:hypothetical protein AVEN_48656-1 [Araneus ventricosus]|uniref:Uncharacterized protein n=1 Tax=Araneus ventricosus TaxID=182803 RepID=A0A4Y2TLM6_ARAVE|nr:hypothetical protein AVEN_48656-1 [Araneus ventricosus]
MGVNILQRRFVYPVCRVSSLSNPRFSRRRKGKKDTMMIHTRESTTTTDSHLYSKRDIAASPHCQTQYDPRRASFLDLRQNMERLRQFGKRNFLDAMKRDVSHENVNKLRR